MNVLVDACVWSLLLRRRDESALSQNERRIRGALIEAIREGRVVMIGPVRQEVLSGIRESAQFEKVRAALAAFPDEPITTGDYESAAQLYNVCRARGVACGATDILICALAIRSNWSVLTYDQGLRRCMEAIRPEGLHSASDHL